MNNDSLSEILTSRMKVKNISAKEIALELNQPIEDIQNLVYGNVHLVKKEIFNRVCSYLNLNPLRVAESSAPIFSDTYKRENSNKKLISEDILSGEIDGFKDNKDENKRTDDIVFNIKAYNSLSHSNLFPKHENKEEQEETYEHVNHPNHYNNVEIETFEMFLLFYHNQPDYIKGALIFNIFKYRDRIGKKDSPNDNEKMNWYLDKFEMLFPEDAELFAIYRSDKENR